jgi:sugar lactone lactonase YvrE
MRLMTALLALVITLVASPSVALAQPFPDIIQLPNGFRPEGIAIRGTTFYTGSLSGAADKGVFRGDIRTGESSQLIPGNGGPFVGMKVDVRGRLWIAGGPTGRGYAYDATTGALLRSFDFATAPTFVNDVIVTEDAAWFTESMAPRLYRVAIGPGGAIGAATTVDLTGKIEVVQGFNLNGIAATPDGSTLIVVNSSTGKLYAIDAETIATREIDLGGATVTAGDGILLQGRTLYVVRNQLNQIAVIRLTPDLASGSVARVITNQAFQVPTTIARHGSALYAVNARFGVTDPNATYTVVRVDR